MSSTCDISFIIPCFNSGKTIAKVISSIISNKGEFAYEIIVVDDGSQDNTSDILSDLKSSVPNLTVLNQDHKGASAARNLGMKNSSGRYICFIDSDDYIDASFINKMLTGDNDSDIICCSMVYEYDTYSEVESAITDATYEGDMIMEAFFTGGTGKIHIGPCAKLYRRDIIEGILFDENLVIYEDADFVYRCLKRTKRGRTIGDALYHYNKHVESTMSTKLNEHYMDYFKVLDKEVMDNTNNSKVQKLIKLRYTTTALHLLRLTGDKKLRDYALKYKKDISSGITIPTSLKLKLICLKLMPQLYYLLLRSRRS